MDQIASGDTMAVEIVEVSPRDGLQNEPVILATDDKVELIERCVAAGLRRVEIASFVHPERVPQMADAEAVCERMVARREVVYSALVLNRRGYERARAAELHELNMVVLATESFSRRNQGMSIRESLDALAEVAGDHRADGGTLTVTIGASFGCPFEGEVELAAVLRVANAAAEIGVDELCLADTIGVGSPKDVRERVGAVARAVPGIPLRCHFHDTRNTGIANAVAAVESGVGALDASLGGIGGCPFAPRAAGNIATEDLAYVLTRMRVPITTSVPRLVAHIPWIEERLGKQVPGMLSRAGGFPDGEGEHRG